MPVTFADVLTTMVVIVDRQWATRGWTPYALGVAGLVSSGLRPVPAALPTLVDQFAIDPEALADALSVAGIRAVRRVRSRWVGPEGVVDLVVGVDPALPTADAHAIADTVERRLEQHRRSDI